MRQNILPDEEIQTQIGQYDPEFSFRTLVGKSALITSVIAVALSLFHIYTAGFGVLLAMKHRAVHLTLVMTLIFLLFPAKTTPTLACDRVHSQHVFNRSILKA